MIRFSEVSSIVDFVIQAGKKVHEIYKSEYTVQMKGIDDPLTNADIEANTMIVNGIRGLFPDDGIFSEEIFDDKRRLNQKRVWIIDPIDGTREFVAKRNEFCISVGLSIHHKPVLGIILNPATGELFVGAAGFGVFFQALGLDFIFDSTSIQFQVPSKKSRNEKYLIVSRSEFESGLFSKQEFWKSEYILKPTGSIAYKLALVALGFYPLTISLRPKNEWDICAGVALVEASGQTVWELGSYRNFEFNKPDSIRNGIVAGENERVQELVGLHQKEIQVFQRN